MKWYIIGMSTFAVTIALVALVITVKVSKANRRAKENPYVTWEIEAAKLQGNEIQAQAGWEPFAIHSTMKEITVYVKRRKVNAEDN